MRKLFAAFLLLVGTSALAYAQISPFDMSGERPTGAPPAAPRPTPPAQPVQPNRSAVPMVPQAVAPQPAPPSAPVHMQPPASAAPPVGVIPAAPTPAPAMPSVLAPVKQPTTPSAAHPVAAAPQTGDSRRYVIPFSELGLGGEYDRRSWTIYLTTEQAAAKARFTFTYRNAIVVAPEASKLTVFINNRAIGQQQVGSPDSPSAVSFEVPQGLLQPGANLITFEANQRHRTDCTVDSTYELWSNIDPSGTYLGFAGGDVSQPSGTDAIRAIGVDSAGKTEFDLVVPAMEQPGTTKPLLRLAQGLSLLSGMPNQIFAFSADTLPAGGPGKMAVLVGTAPELRPIFPGLPQGAESAPLAAFVTNPRNESPVLLISGPSWQAVSTAIDTIVSPTDRAPEIRRDVLTTQRWTAPDAPLLFADTRIPLSQLGIRTVDFSGRRFRTSFNIAVPADFYANAYGEAKILLDAAYSSKVLPGSHVDTYVNGDIASTVPIATTNGGIFRQLPIRVTMRHFRPGLNSIAIEAVLMTEDDAACAPGATASQTPRFALFDTSEFHMPDFARVGQRPNLAAMVGTAYPYGRSPQPTPLFIDRTDADTLSAAATLLGQLAIAAGHPIAIETVASPGVIGDRNAIFIGSISQMPATALTQVNVATASQASWRPVTDSQPTEIDNGKAMEEWRSRITGGALRGRIEALREWLRRNFDITAGSLQFVPNAEQVFTPSNASTLMIAQGKSPNGGGTWTVATSPSAKDLREGLSALTAQMNWPQMSGHVTTYSSRTGKIESVPVTRFDFVPTEGLSIANYRLIAANWLSTNILSYSFLLVVLSLLIGLVTSRMLSRLGRSK